MKKRILLMPASLFLAACSEPNEEDVVEIGEEHGLEVLTIERDLEREAPPCLNREQVEQLFEDIGNSLENDSLQGTERFPEPNEEEALVETEPITLTSRDDSDSDSETVAANVAFHIWIEDEQAGIHPDNAVIQNLVFESSGINAQEWKSMTGAAMIDEEGNLVFSNEGRWKIHFLYGDIEVAFFVADGWSLTMSPDDLREKAASDAIDG
ncbi:hypothetical protein [Alkalicoccus luteus]|uniref:Uncharacterized protein n=1 Tax=Alkalicoccus luteus TaxID=1237094 RepID=A0A969PTA8_9BACI|nr:hypothetical protein [Alkalicoccus luteus]NJP37518.1 hypothetical protein [Alkalicoccus luteus]